MEPLKLANSSPTKQDFWQDQIEQWERSGLSQAVYCQRHELKLATFGYWRRKLKEPSQGKLRLVPLTEGTAVAEKGKGPSVIRLCSKELTVEVTEEIHPLTLRRLIEMLR